jgi:hypothetical protein
MRCFQLFQLVVACVAVLAATAGQVQAGVLNVGTHQSTFEGLTRGYWFTAPTDFVIDGVRVVTDASTENQSVEIVRFTSPVTLFPTFTNDFTSLFSAKDVPGTGFIATGDIFVNSGDLIGVLGSRGGNAVNSYENGPYSSSGFFGNSVTLSRLGMQANLGTTPAADLFTEMTGSLGRVELSYSAFSAVPEPSSLALYGFGACVAGIRAARRRRREKQQDATA